MFNMFVYLERHKILEIVFIPFPKNTSFEFVYKIFYVRKFVSFRCTKFMYFTTHVFMRS